MIAYRPIYLLNTSKIPSVFRMAAPWGNPTLLIDEADQKETGSEAEWVQFVNSRYDGTPIPRYNASTGESETFRSFGLTALALRRMPKDEGTTGRMMKINATISPIELPEVAGKDIYDDFKEIRNKLLYLRLRYFGKLKFVGKSGLPPDQSWRGKETLTLLRVLEQIDPAISQDIEDISKALTKKEIENLTNTWDGLIINEIHAFISDEKAEPRKKNRAIYFVRTYTKSNEEKTSVLNLKYLADRLGASASEISRSMAQFKISTFERFRVDGLKKPQRGVLMFRYLEDTDRIFQRYVPGYAHDLSNVDIQSRFDPYAVNESDPDDPDVPPHDITNDNQKNKNTMEGGSNGTFGTSGTEYSNEIPKSSNSSVKENKLEGYDFPEISNGNSSLEIVWKALMDRGLTVEEYARSQYSQNRYKARLKGKLSDFSEDTQEFLRNNFNIVFQGSIKAPYIWINFPTRSCNLSPNKQS